MNFTGNVSLKKKKCSVSAPSVEGARALWYTRQSSLCIFHFHFSFATKYIFHFDFFLPQAECPYLNSLELKYFFRFFFFIFWNICIPYQLRIPKVAFYFGEFSRIISLKSVRMSSCYNGK